MPIPDQGDTPIQEAPRKDQPKKESDPLLEGIDFSDIQDEKLRTDVMARVREKAKLLDGDYRHKTQTLSEERKSVEQMKGDLKDLIRIREELQNNPELEKKVTKVINQYRAGIKDSEDIDKDLRKSGKLLDKLISEVDDSTSNGITQKSQLENLRKIIKEETVSSEELSKITQELETLKKTALVGIESQLTQQVAKLEDEYGKELVEKYKDKLIATGMKMPHYATNGEFWRILHNVASASEIREALFKAEKKKQEAELKRKERGSPPGSESLPGKVEYPRDRAGRVNVKEFLTRLKDAGTFARS